MFRVIIADDHPIVRQMALTGEFEPRFYAIVDGEFVDDNGVDGAATVTASVSSAETETPEGIPHIIGTFSIHSENTLWDITGMFDAAYCGPFHNAIHINC